MSEPAKPKMRPRGWCQVCGQRFSIRADGNIRFHRDIRSFPRTVCRGSYNRPKDESA